MIPKDPKYLTNIQMINRAKNLFPGISNGEFGISEQSFVPIIELPPGISIALLLICISLFVILNGTIDFFSFLIGVQHTLSFKYDKI